MIEMTSEAIEKKKKQLADQLRMLRSYENLFCSLGTPNRDINFADKSDKFDKHAHKLANTARLVATAGTTRNKRTVEAIHASAQQVSFVMNISCNFIFGLGLFIPQMSHINSQTHPLLMVHWFSMKCIKLSRVTN